MKISRNSLAFMSMLSAGLLLAGATVLLPSAQTFGSETDDANMDRAASIERNLQALYNQPQPAAPSQAPAAAPAPPAAPIDAPAAPAAGNTGGTADAPASLPTAGSGGYLNRSENASLGYMLVGLGAALMGSGSLVWAYSRRLR